MPESIIGFGIAPARPIPDPDLGPIAFLMVTIDVSEVAAGLFDLFSFRLIASKSTPMSANGFVFGPDIFKLTSPMLSVSAQTSDLGSNLC